MSGELGPESRPAGKAKDTRRTALFLDDELVNRSIHRHDSEVIHVDGDGARVRRRNLSGVDSLRNTGVNDEIHTWAMCVLAPSLFFETAHL